MTFMSPAGRSTAALPGTLGPLRMTPGRWVALAVAVPVALALIAWTGFSIVASLAKGSYPFSYPVSVDRGQLAMNVNVGDITLQQGPAGNTARLAGTVQYGLVRPDVSEASTSAGTNFGVNCSSVYDGSCDVNATLDVPPRTAVTLSSNGGDIQASGFSSGMTLWAGGGNVTASDLAGHLQLDTGGGDLTASGLTGDLELTAEGGNINASNLASSSTMRLDTGGGDLTANGLTGDFQLTTEGGNTDAETLASQVVTVQSGGGNVTLAFTRVPENLQITAQGGSVSVVLPPGGTTYDIATPDTAGGNVSIPTSLANSASGDKITIDSGGGDISVSQS
jgi:hypothetical protein